MATAQLSLKQWAIENNSTILNEWNYKKNIDIDIDIEKVGYMSSKKVNWICSKGHNYIAPISKKVIGHRCIYCSNRATLKGFNDLLTTNPEIAIDWDYTKNDKKPDEIRGSEKYKASWICHVCGNDWISYVKTRVFNKTGCPECGKRKSVESRKKNNIAVNGFTMKYPHFLNDWDYSKNDGIDPYTVTVTDKRKIWWHCKAENHSFPATIKYRINDDRCIYCSDKELLSGFNDLFSRKEDLMDEWDYSNNQVDPHKILYKTKKIKVNWKCRFCKTEFQTTAGGHNLAGCSSCRTKQKHARERIAKVANGYNLDKPEFLHLKDDFDVEENLKNGIKWEELTPTYTLSVSWVCHTCGAQWKTSMYKRTIEKTGCPACSHFTLYSGINDLATEHPELVEEWSEKNTLSANQVISGGLESYLWKCRYCGNEWKASVHNRILEGSNCPKCGGKGTSFVEQTIFYYVSMTFSETINRYRDDNNKELDIFIPSILLGIEYDGYHFHKDKQELDNQKNMYFYEKGIRLIRIREINAKNMHLPKLDKEFITYEYKYLSKYKGLDILIKNIYDDMKWNMPDIDSYRDRFDIMHKMHNGFRKNGLSQDNFKYFDMWDYDENSPLNPLEVSLHSTIDINWKCPVCGHKWVRSVVNQRKSKGCPACAKTILTEKYNLASTDPESLNDWNYNENGDITPHNVRPKTHKKYWWNCSVCGKIYHANPNNWRKNRRCAECGQESSRKKRCKKVGQFSLEGDLIQVFESAREANKVTGVNYKSISDVCNGRKKKKTGGYIWKFMN